MSLSTDVLTRATPTRLICRGGRWVLELTRLEAVDRDVFQPRTQRLEGSESILAMLRRSEEGQGLASGAAQIMRAARADEDRAFEVNEGDWVPSAEVPAAGRSASASDGSELSLVVAELRAELVVLRASHSRLRERVSALEAAQSGAVAPPRIPRGSRARRRSEPPGPLAEAPARAVPLADSPGFDRTQASPGLPAAAAAPAAVPAPEAAVHLPPSIEEMARALNVDQRPPALEVPSLQALRDCMATLMDQPPALEKAKGDIELGSLVRPQGCKLLDDEGNERGIVLLDLTAAVMLGAALLGLPRDEALRQIADSDPSEDCLLASSEICNNLTGPVNAVSGNEHVRSTALVSVDVSELPTPRARVELAVEGGNVVLAMF